MLVLAGLDHRCRQCRLTVAGVTFLSRATLTVVTVVYVPARSFWSVWMREAGNIA